MTGANYMGGKRNTVKARGRDKTARIQKGFFERQKMNIISKGLSINADSSTQDVAARMGIADISFAHARQKLPLPATPVDHSWIPEPYTYSSSSPLNDAKRAKLKMHLPLRKAKTLQMIDLNDDHSMKLLLEKIRNTPDLPGLTKWAHISTEKKRARSSTPDDRERAHKRIQFDDSNESDPMPMEDLKDSFPSPVRRYMSEDPIEEDSDSSPRRPVEHFSSMDIPSSTTTEEASEGLPQIGSWSDDLPYDTVRDRDDEELLETSDGSPIIDANGLPKMIRLSQDTSIPVYGTLFERKDPWKTIGRILGMEADDGQEMGEDDGGIVESEESHGAYPRIGREAEGAEVGRSKTPSSEWSYSMRNSGGEGEESDEGEEEGTQPDTFEALEDHSDDEEEDEGAVAGGYQSFWPTSSRASSVVVDHDGDEMAEDGPSSASFVPDEDDDQEIEDHVKSPRPNQTILEHSSPKVAIPRTPSPVALMAKSPSPLEILAVPDLENVDGKFLGPSLLDFDDGFNVFDE